MTLPDRFETDEIGKNCTIVAGVDAALAALVNNGRLNDFNGRESKAKVAGLRTCLAKSVWKASKIVRESRVSRRGSRTAIGAADTLH